MRVSLFLIFLILSFSNLSYSTSRAAEQKTEQLEVEELVVQHLNSEQTATAPELAKLGDWPVGVRTVTLNNPNQVSSTDFTSLIDRPLKVEIWYPSRAKGIKTHAVYNDETRSGKPFSIRGVAYRNLDFSADSSLNSSKEETRFPLLIISHGYTGYRSMMYYLAEHLASHGFVVASIDHTDSTNADVDFSANSGSGFPSTLYNRARDQQFVLEALNATQSDFAQIIKGDSAAILGYSMGGYGALNTVGGCYDFSPQFLNGLGFPKESTQALLPLFNTCSAARAKTDPRWRAMISFAPWGGEQSVHKPAALKQIEIPSLVVAGDSDDVSGFENGVKKLYEQLGSENKYLLIYENARHNIAAHPAPKVSYDNDLDIGHYYEPSWSSQTIAQINKHMVLAFLNCHVKQNKNSCRYLPIRETAAQTKQADGTLSKPWPGFADRWGLGMRFLRGKSTVVNY